MEALFVMSAGMAMNSVFGYADAIDFWAELRELRLRPNRTMWATPASARARAIERPMVPAPPVMTADFCDRTSVHW